MGNDFFRFKQFTVWQGQTAMKVGTDGVLLGALSEPPSDGAECRRVLDVGTGTGLVAMMLAQRFGLAHVVGIDIESSAVGEATANFGKSVFGARLEARLADAVGFREMGEYDMVVSNPPFFAGDLQCPSVGRNVARHDVGLPFARLSETAFCCLRSGGRFVAIVPDDRAVRVIGEAEAAGLSLVRRTRVFTVRRKPAKRSVVQFCKGVGAEARYDELTLLLADGRATEEYRELTSAFYLDEHWG